MNKAKAAIRNLFRRAGYNFSKIYYDGLGLHAFADMRRFITSADPILFDVGANRGQTIVQLQQTFPGGRIFAFEPNATVFGNLKQRAPAAVNLFPLALGSKAGRQTFHQTTMSEFSSFLEAGSKLQQAHIDAEVDVTTIDDFATQHGIGGIDLLKIDTQGYELEVLRGATRMLRENRVHLVYFECTFDDYYKELPPFSSIFELLHEHGFRMVSLYDLHYRDNMLAWADFIFVNRGYVADRVG